MDKLIVFDTTLRDGDQAPGFHFSKAEKLEFAKQLYKLNVDVIEAGFAKSSRGDLEAVRDISEMFSQYGPRVCSLARAVDADIEDAARAVERANRNRIHTFIATSDLHIKEKLKSTREKVLEKSISAVRKARQYVDDVEFSCEDFSRSDRDYIVSVVSEAISAGAGTINLPDTVGIFDPFEARESVKYIIEKVRSKGLDAIFSIHNHNDLGLATANTLAGIQAGARQVEATINGIGERAGNAALEEIVMAMKLKTNYEFNVNPIYLKETSDLCSRFVGKKPQLNKAIVGDNAFAHEAGIHVDGMTKNGNTYEPFPPEMVGAKRRIVYGSRIGMNGLRWVYSQRGITFNDSEIPLVYGHFKEIADHKKDVDESDLFTALDRAGLADRGSLFKPQISQ